MSKKIIVVIVIVLVIVAVWYFLFPKKAVSPVNSAIGLGQDATAKAQDSLGSVDKANPFNVDVSPYSGYKNPFTK
jgi:uncharacterized protein YpmB